MKDRAKVEVIMKNGNPSWIHIKYIVLILPDLPLNVAMDLELS